MATKRRKIRGQTRGNHHIPLELTVAREQRAWHLRSRGYTIKQVTEMLIAEFNTRISTRAVDKALKRVADEVWRETQANVERYKAHQLADLEAIKDEALDSYRQSKGTIVKTVTRKETAPFGTATSITKDATQTQTEVSPGDPRFLNTAIDALKGKAKLLGLDAPLKVQDVSKDRPLEQMSDAELAALVAQGEDAERRRADGRS